MGSPRIPVDLREKRDVNGKDLFIVDSHSSKGICHRCSLDFGYETHNNGSENKYHFKNLTDKIPFKLSNAVDTDTIDGWLRLFDSATS